MERGQRAGVTVAGFIAPAALAASVLLPKLALRGNRGSVWRRTTLGARVFRAMTRLRALPAMSMVVAAPSDRRLQRTSRTAKDPVKLRRAIVVMMSVQGQSVPDITPLMQVSSDYVRQVVHTFNERGSKRWTQNGAESRPRRSVTGHASTCAGSCVTKASVGSPPPRGRPRTTPISSPRCSGCWNWTSTRPPAGGWSASMSSGR